MTFTTLQTEIIDRACLMSSWTSFFDTVPRNVSLNTRPIVEMAQLKRRAQWSLELCTRARCLWGSV
jgi:hypothetical protein